jgi:polar amino acid transport system permease protein
VAFRTLLSWFYLAPDERYRPIPWFVVLLNWLLATLLLVSVCVFAFTRLQYSWNWDSVASYSGFFWRGWFNTLYISALTLILSSIIGLIVAVTRRSGLLVLRAISRLYVEVVRGSPLLVQIIFGFYVIADAFKIQDRFSVGLLSLSLFAGAYISEIFRAGIDNIGASQLESARAVGFTRLQTYRYVIFPQAIRSILPPMAGMFANLIKDSSLLSVISIEEFTWNAQQVNALTYSTFEAYIPVFVGYLALTLPITFWTQWLERRTKYET